MKEQNTNKQKKQKENTSPKHMSIRSILGGDILANDFFKRQTSLLILIMILTILYIDNRYTSQQELIEIDRLKKELTDIKYDALPAFFHKFRRTGQCIVLDVYQFLFQSVDFN